MTVGELSRLQTQMTIFHFGELTRVQVLLVFICLSLLIINHSSTLVVHVCVGTVTFALK